MSQGIATLQAESSLIIEVSPFNAPEEENFSMRMGEHSNEQGSQCKVPASLAYEYGIQLVASRQQAGWCWLCCTRPTHALHAQ